MLKYLSYLTSVKWNLKKSNISIFSKVLLSFHWKKTNTAFWEYRFRLNSWYLSTQSDCDRSWPIGRLYIKRTIYNGIFRPMKSLVLAITMWEGVGNWPITKQIMTGKLMAKLLNILNMLRGSTYLMIIVVFGSNLKSSFPFLFPVFLVLLKLCKTETEHL